MPEPITADRLERLGACHHQVRRFRELFGSGQAPLTVETAIAHAQEFDWLWAARHLLTLAALAAFKEAEEAAWAAYLEAIASARADYETALATTQEVYRETLATVVFAKAATLARAAYREALAIAFAEAYLAQ